MNTTTVDPQTISSSLSRLGQRAVENAESHMLRSENISANSTAPDYSSGLAGVNLALDQQLTRWLFASMILVALFVAGMRIIHLYTAHVRHMHSMHATNQEQNYWTYDRTWWLPWVKKEFIYAPLGKKRHNREWQLGKAVNYGTLPGRAHTVLLSFYILSNFVYMMMLPYGSQEAAKTIAELRGRSGYLAVVNMLPLVVLAGRNNPLINLLKISFDNFNLFHRWIGRIAILEAFIHVAAWYANSSAEHGASAAIAHINGNLFLTSGLVAMVAMVVILFQSLSAVRHAFYETFLHGHIMLAFAIFVGTYVHVNVEKLPARPYMRMIVICWSVERLIRLIRILYLNIGYRRREATKVIIEALPGEACRVTYQLPRHTFIRPGSHVYAYLPAFAWHMNHPFSVAWTNKESEPPVGPPEQDWESAGSESSALLNKETLSNNLAEPPLTAGLKSPNYLERKSMYSSLISKRQRPPTSLSLICAARTGMTRKIYDAAMAAPNRTIFTSGFIEGPYAGHDNLHSYGTVVLFAGGAGITHHLVQIRHLLAGAHCRTVATRKIVLAWSVRDLEALTWVAPWMDEILKMPGRRDILEMNLFVTKPKSRNDYVSPSKSIKLRGERCVPAKILDSVLRFPGGRVGACFVSVCGPGAFADEVRSAVRERMWAGGLDMNEESFTW